MNTSDKDQQYYLAFCEKNGDALSFKEYLRARNAALDHFRKKYNGSEPLPEDNHDLIEWIKNECP